MAVAVIVCATTFAFAEFAYLVIGLFRWRTADGIQQADTEFVFSAAFVVTTGGFIALAMICGSLWKIIQLRAGGGGSAIAEQVGGVHLTSAGNDPNKVRVLNIVEEMAIANGIPSPKVYLLEKEQAINAFAAGYDPEHAVIGVTRGCIEKLKRDQLQGVIAHEFSHVVNGDMRLSIQMVGVLHGIFMIYMLGEQLTNYGWALFSSDRHAYHSEDGRDWLFRCLALVLGILLSLVGMLGVVCGALIQSGMSRQREFLADAAAVDSTRNPDGIGGALKVIGGFEKGSQLKASTTEVSHMLFADGSYSLMELLASHPPLVERILRIDPSWDGAPEFESEDQISSYVGPYDQTLGLVGGRSQSPAATQVATQIEEEQVDRHAVPMFQDGSEQHQQFVSSLKASLPQTLLRPLQEPVGVVSLAYAFMMPTNPQRLESQVQTVSSGDADVAELVKLFCELLQPLDEAQHLLLLDETDRALQNCEASVLRDFGQKLSQLPADWAMDEWQQWAARRMFARRAAEASGQWPPKARYGSVDAILAESQLVLSAVVHCGGSDAAMANYTYQRGAVHTALHDTSFTAINRIAAVDRAVTVVAKLSPRARRQFLVACGACLAADLDVSPGEAAIMRGICSSLNTPIPELYPGQRVLPGA